jgi:hypothetical protein
MADDFPLPSVETPEVFVDYSDLKVVKRELKYAFDHWNRGNGGRTGRVPMAPKPPGFNAKERKRQGLKAKADYTPAPTKFCFDRVMKMIRLLGIGLYWETVCSVAGIPRERGDVWLKRGYQEPNHKDPYYVFARAVEAVSSGVEVKHVGNIVRALSLVGAKDSADISFRFLRARYPMHWSERGMVDVTSGGKPLENSGDRVTKVVLVKVDGTTATPASPIAKALGKTSG